MNLLFASDSWWTWDCEKNFRLLKEQNPELVQAAQRGHSVTDPETGLPVIDRDRQTKGMSLDAVALENQTGYDGNGAEKQSFTHREKR